MLHKYHRQADQTNLTGHGSRLTYLTPTADCYLHGSEIIHHYLRGEMQVVYYKYWKERPCYKSTHLARLINMD